MSAYFVALCESIRDEADGQALSAYSADGGEVATTVRVTTPFSSKACSFAVRTFAEIFGMSDR